MLFGISVFILVKDIFSGNYIFLLLVLLGSILPDLDERHSKINQWAGILGTIAAFFTKHRGILHSLPFNLILLLAVTFFAGKYYALAISIGYVSHLIADGLTPMGVHLFYPFSNFRIRGPIRTGSFLEGTLSVVLFVTIIIQLL
jgi:inner membrane protein